MIITLFSLPRWKKRFIITILDLILIPFSVWVSFALRLGTWDPKINDGVWMLIMSPLITIPIFSKLGLYKAIIRFIGGQQAVMGVLGGVSLSVLILALMAVLADWQGIPRSVFPIYWGTAFLLVGGSRYIIRLIYTRYYLRAEKTHVVIYGAGDAGMQLANALARHHEYRIVAYVDDNPTINKAIIQGLQVYKPEDLPELINKFSVGQVFLALPSVSKIRKKEILQNLESLPVHILTIPSMSELISGKSSIADLREIEVDELLGRDIIDPDYELLTICIKDHTVMVTGAGGSIGSELCRQILYIKPKKLILYEASEFALYNIESELLKLISSEKLEFESKNIFPVLGSVQNQTRLEEVMQRYRVNTLYHAAAYKHVPLVETNPLEGIRNNTFGTLYTALAARHAQVRHFVLISTDKAVRPTNVMGASKRIAELVLQALAEQPSRTIFSIVRFGNVLGSSGSVVPLFRKQIKEGGPLTVTHPDIIRYFMTIPEAAQLVIQAGALAKGGEVFLLDMGEPVKIIDLARRMIHLSGYTVKDDQNIVGNIEIKFTGLRPGEKLYEELLIDSQADKTAHPKIFKAHEALIPWPTLELKLKELDNNCSKRDLYALQKLIEELVSGFKGLLASDNHRKTND
ncbi:MAG: polysaccharide biosynthesis protein [Thiothrix sp.]|nr:MAG: polysaccharide biosynthesis protein [Thiothrix sp.]